MEHTCQFTSLIKALPSANLLISEQTTGSYVVAVSAGFLKLTGSVETDIVGKEVFQVFEGDLQNLRASLVLAESNEPAQKCALRFQSPRYAESFDLFAEHAIIKEGSGKTYILQTLEKTIDTPYPQDVIKLTQTKTNLRNLINGTDDLVWSVDKDLKIITANQPYCEMMKLATDRFFGEGDEVIIAGFGEERTSRWKGYYQKALSGVKFTVREEILNTSANKMQYGLISFSPMYDDSGQIFGVACFSKDITRDVEQISQLKESEKRYSDLFHLSPQPMWIYSLKTLQFIDVNDSAVRHYGYSKREFFSMTIRDIRPVDELERMEKAVESHRRSYDYFSNETFTHLKKNGEHIKVEIQSNTISVRGITCRIVLINDITERINYLKALESQNKKLKEIAWTQSHIVRAPLTRIMGLIDVVENQKISSAEESMIRTNLLKSVHEIDTIIKDIILKAEHVEYDIKHDGN
ncbi:hypothetical protein CNR22_01190 [Sphingobacteriaceae bacterium]|nr:hypothetical protein CNR22_01190 [Sphingobacteriaceae bacterium]